MSTGVSARLQMMGTHRGQDPVWRRAETAMAQPGPHLDGREGEMIGSAFTAALGEMFTS
jgi:hypothetical protein